MSATNGSSPRTDHDDERPGLALRVVAAVGVVSTLALFGFLIVFAIVGGDTRNPDELDQDAFPTVADEVCARHRATIDELPGATEATDPAERADTIARANDVLAAMVADLRAEVAARAVVDDLSDDEAAQATGALSGKDRSNLDAWLADYEVFVADRQQHVARLRDEGDVPFLQSDKQGSPVSEWIDGYARVNDMESCEVPLDL